MYKEQDKSSRITYIHGALEHPTRNLYRATPTQSPFAMTSTETNKCIAEAKTSMDFATLHASTGEAESNLVMTPAEERKLVRKIDLQ